MWGGKISSVKKKKKNNKSLKIWVTGYWCARGGSNGYAVLFPFYRKGNWDTDLPAQGHISHKQYVYVIYNRYFGSLIHSLTHSTICL